MGLPINYKIQDGCWNCQHKFIWSQQDEDPVYYCHEDGSKRPLCDTYNESISTYIEKKGFTFLTGNKKKEKQYYDEMIRLDELWKNWAKEHLVQQSGICSEHRK
jgi:hypothetical protein